MISFMAQAVCSAVSARPPMRARMSAGQLGVSIVSTYSGGQPHLTGEATVRSISLCF
jgi:hypothetical protein